MYRSLERLLIGLGLIVLLTGLVDSAPPSVDAAWPHEPDAFDVSVTIVNANGTPFSPQAGGEKFFIKHLLHNRTNKILPFNTALLAAGSLVGDVEKSPFVGFMDDTMLKPPVGTISNIDCNNNNYCDFRWVGTLKPYQTVVFTTSSWTSGVDGFFKNFAWLLLYDDDTITSADLTVRRPGAPLAPPPVVAVASYTSAWLSGTTKEITITLTAKAATTYTVTAQGCGSSFKVTKKDPKTFVITSQSEPNFYLGDCFVGIVIRGANKASTALSLRMYDPAA